jgi:hypothetical protein
VARDLRTLEIGAATALVGVGIFQIHNLYTEHAGSLHDMRQASSDDVNAQQQLRDADCLGGAMTLLAGGALSLAVHKWYPLAIAGAAYLIVCGYYHVSLQQPSTTPLAHVMAESGY